MNTDIIHIELIKRKQTLLDTSSILKERFLGIDHVIDEVISLMMPWFLFPHAQTRPTVINLWGLTGSGKTALIQSLVELLDYRSLYTHLDMGEFESDSASWMKNILTDDLEFFHQKPVLICLDEFQFANTIDANNKELGKDKLRVIWDLIDSGKLEYIPGHSTYYLFRADNCLKRLKRLTRSEVQLKDGEVISDISTFTGIFEGFYFDNFDRIGKPVDKDYFLSEDFIGGLCGLFDNDNYTRKVITDHVRSADLNGLTRFIVEGMKARPATRTLDLSKALIFVLGNLDEAYTMSHNLNPDISADDFHEATTKITIADVKKALRKRFRSEQIARLGNNHVIYTAFNNAHFRLLIRRELSRIGNFVHDQFGWLVSFDESVVNVIYSEGVFPAQGTRPVFTTVKNLVESRISKLVVTILEYQLTIAEIHWKYESEQFLFSLFDGQGKIVGVIPDNVKLKLENLRKSVEPELQAHTAVHEAGHAILAALTLRIIPSAVVSRTATDAEGFCLINFPKGPLTRETLRKDIIITLGGYVAEKMIFGEDLTSSGVYLDIEEASTLANKAVRNYAMGSDPIHLAVESTKNDNLFYNLERYSSEAIAIIRECEAEATRLLARNKLLLLKMADYLTHHSRMDEDTIRSFMMMYAKEEWVSVKGFIKKDSYYSFNSAIQRQLDEIDKTEAACAAEYVDEQI